MARVEDLVAVAVVAVPEVQLAILILLVQVNFIREDLDLVVAPEEQEGTQAVEALTEVEVTVLYF